jgi:hypothetical protein
MRVMRRGVIIWVESTDAGTPVRSLRTVATKGHSVLKDRLPVGYRYDGCVGSHLF